MDTYRIDKQAAQHRYHSVIVQSLVASLYQGRQLADDAWTACSWKNDVQLTLSLPVVFKLNNSVAGYSFILQSSLQIKQTDERYLAIFDYSVLTGGMEAITHMTKAQRDSAEEGRSSFMEQVVQVFNSREGPTQTTDELFTVLGEGSVYQKVSFSVDNMRWAISEVLKNEPNRDGWQCEEIELPVPDLQATGTGGYGSLILIAATGKAYVGWQEGDDW